MHIIISLQRLAAPLLVQQGRRERAVPEGRGPQQAQRAHALAQRRPRRIQRHVVQRRLLQDACWGGRMGERTLMCTNLMVCTHISGRDKFQRAKTPKFQRAKTPKFQSTKTPKTLALFMAWCWGYRCSAGTEERSGKCHWSEGPTFIRK